MGRTKEEIECGARVFGNAANTLGVIGEGQVHYILSCCHCLYKLDEC